LNPFIASFTQHSNGDIFMAVSLFSFVDMFSRAVATASHLLTKGAEHSRAAGGSDDDILDWRLIEDMQPLRFQMSVVCNFTRQWLARAADLPLPADIDVETMTVAQLQTALADAQAYLASLTPEQFAGRDDAPLTVKLGGGTMEPTLPAGQWVTNFATTNILFHLSTAYGILRSKGVQIGKLDLFPTGL
jgi:hypothetical protein